MIFLLFKSTFQFLAFYLPLSRFLFTSLPYINVRCVSCCPIKKQHDFASSFNLCNEWIIDPANSQLLLRVYRPHECTTCIIISHSFLSLFRSLDINPLPIIAYRRRHLYRARPPLWVINLAGDEPDLIEPPVNWTLPTAGSTLSLSFISRVYRLIRTNEHETIVIQRNGVLAWLVVCRFPD